MGSVRAVRFAGSSLISSLPATNENHLVLLCEPRENFSRLVHLRKTRAASIELRAVSHERNAVARAGWLLQKNELSSPALVTSMGESRGMDTSYSSRQSLEHWEWCSAAQSPWYVHLQGAGEAAIKDLKTGETLHRIPRRRTAIDPTGQRIAFVEDGKLQVLDVPTGERLAGNSLEMVEPKIWTARDEAWFTVSSSFGKRKSRNRNEELNIGERALIYRWGAGEGEGAARPTLIRELYLSALNLGQVAPVILARANAVFLSPESGKCALLPIDPLEHARSYCARSSKALPEWRRIALGLLDEGAGE